MKIESLKELEAVLKVCRKHGVDEIAIDGIKMRIGVPSESKTASKDDGIELPMAMTDEQLMFWSSGPVDNI